MLSPADAFYSDQSSNNEGEEYLVNAIRNFKFSDSLELIKLAEVAHFPLFEDHAEAPNEAGFFTDNACPPLRIGPYLLLAT